MKKLTMVIFFLAIALFGLTGCVNNDNGKINVYASIYPMYDFAKKIGGEKVKVNMVVPHGIEPHNYEPDATLITKLSKADLFIYNGAGMEFWVDKILNQLKGDKPKVLRTVCDIDLIDSDHDHSHGADEHHEDDLTQSKDPHVWLNPMNAKIQMNAIKDALIEIDYPNQNYYISQYEHYAQLLDELHEDYERELSTFTNRRFIVSHQAFGYLEHAYDLEQKAIEGLSRESEPDFSQILEAITYAKEHYIGVIFYEEAIGPKIANSIAAEINGTVDKLNPIEAISKEAERNGVDYFSIMRDNLAALKNAFQISETRQNQSR